jgi:hypothetical protein
MRRAILMLAVLAAPAIGQQVRGPALPGAARPKAAETIGEVSSAAPVNGVLVLYGNQRCPTNTNGDEVVVCVRRSASEQFRVPKELRELEITPENEAWAARSQGTLAAGVGANSIGSCSAVGVGGASGCFGQAARVNRATNKEREKTEAPDLDPYN